MSIESEIRALQAQYEVLKVETIHEWAEEHTESAIHKSLEWDNDRAGYQYRLGQIRQLIAIHVRSPEGVRQIVSLTIDRVRPGGGFRDLDRVMSQPDLRSVLLRDALADLTRLQTKYAQLTELASVWEAVNEVRVNHSRSEADTGSAGAVA
jgi:hypothetical protein